MELPDILRSKRFWSALLGLLAMVIISVAPSLQEHIEILIPGVVGIIGILIGGYAVEDAVQANRHEE